MRALINRTFVVQCYLACALFTGGISFVQAADDTQPPTVPGSSVPGSDDVQDRGIQRGQLGQPLAPIPVLPKRPSGFYCLKSNRTCYCDRSKQGDCALMRELICAPGTYKDTTPLDGECTAWKP